MSVFIALLENLPGSIDDIVPYILQTCASELSYLTGRTAYRRMIMQTVCMAFHYNAGLAFTALEQAGQTAFIFQSLMMVVDELTFQFELRRVVFGLTAVVASETMPGQLPVVMQCLAQLAVRL